MRAAIVLSITLGLLLVCMLACPLIEAATRSFSGHECHGEQTDQKAVSCCEQDGILVTKFLLSVENPIDCSENLENIPTAAIAPSFSYSPPAYLCPKNADHLALLSVLRI